MEKEMTNGYRLAEDVFKRTKENHGVISDEDTIRIISFFGFNEESLTSSSIGHVCSMARERFKRVIENALVYDDYAEFDVLMRLITKKAKCRASKEKKMREILTNPIEHGEHILIDDVEYVAEINIEADCDLCALNDSGKCSVIPCNGIITFKKVEIADKVL